MIKNKSGFSLIEVLITMIMVGILSTLCGAMLIFAYSMFDKVMGNGTASIEYKTFRLKTERIFRNMTKDGPLVMDLITNDTGMPPTPAQEENCIKFEIEYFKYPYDTKTYKRKYNEPPPSNATTVFCTNNPAGTPHGAHAASCKDPGTWNGNVGRTVSVYSCIESEKVDANYKRYMMRMEIAENGKKVVALYTWPAKTDLNDKFVSVSTANVYSVYPTSAAVRDVMLSDVTDFQVTKWPSNLYPNRIRTTKFANIGVVRLYVKLGEESDAQYSNDMIFANKSVYGDVDSFFTNIEDARVLKN